VGPRGILVFCKKKNRTPGFFGPFFVRGQESFQGEVVFFWKGAARGEGVVWGGLRGLVRFFIGHRFL